MELRDALATLKPPKGGDDEISAGFFHRTLARWLGLPEGKQKRATPPLWSYDLWKAELVDDGDGKYTARLFKRPEGDPEVVRYWIAKDASGRIRKSGWLTQAPVLLEDDGAPKAFAPAEEIAAHEIVRLYSSDD